MARPFAPALAAPALAALCLAALCLTLAGCANHAPNSADADPSAPRRLNLANATDEALRPFVGKAVIVVGEWNGRAKLAGMVAGRGGAHIYLQPTDKAGFQRQNELRKLADGTPIQVEGTLQLYQPTDAESQLHDTAPQFAYADRHYYFDAAEAKVTPTNAP